MSNTDPKSVSDAANVYRVLKRVGFKGSKNQVIDQLNAYANLRDNRDLFFKEVFSTLGYALQAVKPSELGPLLSGHNLFLQNIDNDAVDFKINAKNVLKIKNENLTTYEDVALSNLKKMGIDAFAVVAISEELKSSKQRLTKLNPIRSLGVFRLTWVTIAALFSNILALASSIFIMVVYDRVLPNSAVESLYALAIGVVLAVLFDSLLRSAKSGIINRATEGADIIVSEEIYNQFVEISGAKNVQAPKSVDEIIAFCADQLTAYQGPKLAQSYLDFVARFDDAELQEAVARSYHKLLSYKDEYEVARLLTQTKHQAEAAFDGDLKLSFHLAPPILSKTGPDGRPVKRIFGPMIARMFPLLARLKVLRGTPFDLFGYSAERKMERALIRQYETDMKRVLAGEIVGGTATALARLPMDIRGFGPVKDAAVKKVALKRDALLAA